MQLMTKPITDKAEVSIDFPDKFYHGSFGHLSRYDVSVDAQGVHIALDRPGEDHRHVSFHLHHRLFTGIVDSIAEEVADHDEIADEHRRGLKQAVSKLAAALGE